MPTSQTPSKQTEVVEVLLISSQPEATASLRLIFDEFQWLLHELPTCGEALTHVRESDTAVVICEGDLPDGDWRLVLNRFESLPNAPALIVTSRLANNELWAEVLNLGGYDVLAQPFDPQEVHRVIFLAWHAQKNRLQGSAGGSSGRAAIQQAKSRAATS